MRIGELAARYQLNPKTIRYYESIGLLPEAGRTESGYRQYGDVEAERLEFILRAKTLGLSLEDIRTILAVQADGGSTCGQVLAYIDARVQAIDARIRALHAFRDELVTLRSSCTEHGDCPRHCMEMGGGCPLIQRLPWAHAPQEVEEPLHR